LDAALSCFAGLATGPAAVELGALPKKLEMSRCFMVEDQTMLITTNVSESFLFSVVQQWLR
jgi:hypothetical protein